DGFGPDAWQGPAAGKTNWHARYLQNGDALSALFPAQAATLRVRDIAAISYWTSRAAEIPATRDWWLQLYTRPTGSGDAASWYHRRVTSDYQSHGAGDGAWHRWGTDGPAKMTFKPASGTAQTLNEAIASYGSELVEMLSVHTDSGWNGFDGLIDGLEIRLADGSLGRVDFASEDPDVDYVFGTVLVDQGGDSPTPMSIRCWHPVPAQTVCNNEGGVLVPEPLMCPMEDK
ncbi:MAG: hypothetical protein KC635_21425, partial [Myxococcales bacterium]|nr:hypothetical protein [Myxococcales bacterium]